MFKYILLALALVGGQSEKTLLKRSYQQRMELLEHQVMLVKRGIKRFYCARTWSKLAVNPAEAWTDQRLLPMQENRLTTTLSVGEDETSITDFKAMSGSGFAFSGVKPYISDLTEDDWNSEFLGFIHYKISFKSHGDVIGHDECFTWAPTGVCSEFPTVTLIMWEMFL